MVDSTDASDFTVMFFPDIRGLHFDIGLSAAESLLFHPDFFRFQPDHTHQRSSSDRVCFSNKEIS